MDNVLVLCPGRTATTSVSATLSRHRVGHVVTHNADWPLWIERRRHEVNFPIPADQAAAAVHEMNRMRQFEVALSQFREEHRGRIAVGVRFPFDHVFSVLAYTIDNQLRWMMEAGLASGTAGGHAVDADGYRAVVEEAAELYCEQVRRDPGFLDRRGTGAAYAAPGLARNELRNFVLFYMKYMQTWLRRELQGVLGIDLLSRSRRRDGEGYSLFELEAADVLVYALDHPRLDLSACLAAFLGVEGLQVRHDNDSRSRNPGFHGLAMDAKARLRNRDALLAAYRGDPLLQAIYAGTGIA